MSREFSSIPEGGVDVFGDGIGFVKLVQHCGTELDVVNAARVSFHKESRLIAVPEDSPDFYEKDEDVPVSYHLEEADKGLLRFLLKNRHGTPFEQGFMSQWHVRAPIFVFREWHRHRIGISINEESGRYVELRPDFYVAKNIRTQVGKPGAYTFEPVKDEFKVRLYEGIIQMGQEDAWERYQYLLRQGVAKEVARQVLPLSIYSEMRWTANARSLLNFFSLRSAETAQWEIRQYSLAMEEEFAKHMPVTYQAFVDNGRIAP